MYFRQQFLASYLAILICFQLCRKSRKCLKLGCVHTLVQLRLFVSVLCSYKVSVVCFQCVWIHIPKGIWLQSPRKLLKTRSKHTCVCVGKTWFCNSSNVPSSAHEMLSNADSLLRFKHSYASAMSQSQSHQYLLVHPTARINATIWFLLNIFSRWLCC